MPSVQSQTYSERAAKHSNAAARQLLELMERKNTNLCVSVDVTSKIDFLAVVDACGPFVCVVKADRNSLV
jgi:orotidine-5'-phosphate decarboxylase